MVYERGSSPAVGQWRKPLMKLYDYNHDLGSNYYQPMLSYLHEKDTDGPFHVRRSVRLPERAEVLSDKYTNMRYEDMANTDMAVDDFLERSHKQNIRDVNSATAASHRLALSSVHRPFWRQEPSPFSDARLLGANTRTDQARNHYRRELGLMNLRDSFRRRDEALQREEEWIRAHQPLRLSSPPPPIFVYDERYDALGGPAPLPPYYLEQKPLLVDENTRDKINDVRAKLYFAYRPISHWSEVKQWLE